MQLQVNEQLQEMCIEYKDLCDLFLSVLATAENMVNDSKKNTVIGMNLIAVNIKLIMVWLYNF